jgi:hypothetical protein
LISVGSEVQILPGPPNSGQRGRSSAGRAPALQAGGRRFEPDRLQASAPLANGLQRRRLCRGAGAEPLAFLRLWPRTVAEKNNNSAASSVGRPWRVRACGWRAVVFVRVNQVLVRLWARRRSHDLTGKRPPCHEGVGCQRPMADAFRGVATRAARDGGVRCMCVCVRGASCAVAVVVRKGVAGSCAWWVDFERDKGIRWMPWHQEAMKDVARCEKPWGAASRR